MSLFNVVNWWTAQCTDLDENYDAPNLLCARFGLDEQEKDYVVVGSHGGHLSIFYPSLDLDRIENGNGFRATDLLLESRLSKPILGVHAGRFSGSVSENCNQLVVLHPISIAIYNIQTVGGVAEHGTQLRLHLVLEYQFQRVAYAFCRGHFGQVKGREFFCILHVDGTLSFFEQDGISYECRFPGQRALPAPLAYCERTDSFLRFSATWHLECFTYQDLSHSSINHSQYQPVWSVCIGECILDMCVVQAKEESASIMILGERSFINLSDAGKVNFILKLDYAPKCFLSFVLGYYWESSARLITAIVSDKGKLFIYDGASIIWAAQYQDDIPVAMQRSNIAGLPGAIVALGSTGQLNIGYLGSDPYIFKVPPLNVEEITFEKAYKELMQLEEEIREAVDIKDMDTLNRRATADFVLDFSLDNNVTDDFDELLLDIPADVAVKELSACKGHLKFRSKIDLAEMQIIFNMPEGIRCSQESLSYIDVSAGFVDECELVFFIGELLHIHTARIDVVASFISARGIPRVVQQSACLPLAMFYKVRQPQKTALIKLTYTITSKSMTPKLATFFPEFVTWENDVQALGLVLLCPADGVTEEFITIVAAKNSNRFRLQSDNLEAFPLILERFITTTLEHERNPMSNTPRVKGQYNRTTDCILASPVLPVSAILTRMDSHRETQRSLRQQSLEIDELWDKFKSLQRKLQEKADDEPKEALVMQIEENYDQLIIKGDKLMEMRKDERRQRCDLSCALTVAKWIIGTLRMEEKLINVINSVLCTPVEDWTELSWEESMSPGIDMLHHYGPLTRSKQPIANDIAAAASTSFEQFDYNRFRRHFTMLFDRILHLASNDTTEQSAPNAAQSIMPSEKHQKDNLNEMNQMLMMSSKIDARNLQTFSGVGGAAVERKHHAYKQTTLEAVEDDDEDDNENDDIDDLSKAGYKKERQQANNGTNQNVDGETSEWVTENFELPSSEELFSNLGIWW